MEFTVEGSPLSCIDGEMDGSYKLGELSTMDIGELPSLPMVAVHRTPDVENYSGSDDRVKQASKAALR
jgi:hypothetical protein